MSFNNKIIKWLTISILIFTIILFVNIVWLDNKIVESFTTSFISGAIVSLVVTYIQYKKEKIDIIYYCNNEIIKYYQLLNNLLLTLNNNDLALNTKIALSKKYFNNYLENNRFRENSIQLNLVMNNIDNKFKEKIYERLFEYTNGVELMKHFFKPNKLTLNSLISLCEKQRKDIDEGMTILTKLLNIECPWEEMKKYMDYERFK